MQLNEQERRVCQLINDQPIAPGRYRIGIGMAERDGRTVFQPSGFFHVPQTAPGKQAAA